MLLARGSIEERAFGKVVGLMARRGMNGQVTVTSAGSVYALVLQEGHVVAASSPVPADQTISIARSHGVITEVEEEATRRRLAIDHDADELTVCGAVASLGPDRLHRLRRRVIAQRAARIFGLEQGEFVMTSTVALPVVPDCEIHVGAVIYHGARTHLAEPRLRALVQELGDRFTLRDDAFDDLAYFGFGERERFMLRLLPQGVSIATIQAIQDEPERRVAQAMVYALASCGALACETAPPRMARGTEGTPRDRSIALQGMRIAPAEPSAKTVAEEAFRRGQAALRADRIGEAVSELRHAADLVPDESRYLATLAWATFCWSGDKAAVAAQTRMALRRAIMRSSSPSMAHYYLGLVERILGRNDEALAHFREVLMFEPKHTDAETEIRFLLRRASDRSMRPKH